MQDSEAVQRLPGNDQHGTRQLRDYKAHISIGPRGTHSTAASQQSSVLGTSRASLSGTMPTTIPEHPDETYAAESLQGIQSGARSGSSSALAESEGAAAFATSTTKVVSPPGVELDPAKTGSGAGRKHTSADCGPSLAGPVPLEAQGDIRGSALQSMNAEVDAVAAPDAAGSSSSDAAQAAVGGRHAPSSLYAAAICPPSFENYLDQGKGGEMGQPAAHITSAPLQPSAVANVGLRAGTPVSASLVDLSPNKVPTGFQLRPIEFSESSETSRGQSGSVWAMSNALLSPQANKGDVAAAPSVGVPAVGSATAAENSTTTATATAAANPAATLTQSTVTSVSSEMSDAREPVKLHYDPTTSTVLAASALSATSVDSPLGMSPGSVMSDGVSSPGRVSPRPRTVCLSRKVLHASAEDSGSEASPTAVVLESPSDSQRPARSLSFAGNPPGAPESFTKAPLGSQQGRSITADTASAAGTASALSGAASWASGLSGANGAASAGPTGRTATSGTVFEALEMLAC